MAQDKKRTFDPSLFFGVDLLTVLVQNMPRDTVADQQNSARDVKGLMCCSQAMMKTSLYSDAFFDCLVMICKGNFVRAAHIGIECNYPFSVIERCHAKCTETEAAHDGIIYDPIHLKKAVSRCSLSVVRHVFTFCRAKEDIFKSFVWDGGILECVFRRRAPDRVDVMRELLRLHTIRPPSPDPRFEVVEAALNQAGYTPNPCVIDNLVGRSSYWRFWNPNQMIDQIIREADENDVVAFLLELLPYGEYTAKHFCCDLPSCILECASYRDFDLVRALLASPAWPLVSEFTAIYITIRSTDDPRTPLLLDLIHRFWKEGHRFDVDNLLKKMYDVGPLNYVHMDEDIVVDVDVYTDVRSMVKKMGDLLTEVLHPPSLSLQKGKKKGEGDGKGEREREGPSISMKGLDIAFRLAVLYDRLPLLDTIRKLATADFPSHENVFLLLKSCLERRFLSHCDLRAILVTYAPRLKTLPTTELRKLFSLVSSEEHLRLLVQPDTSPFDMNAPISSSEGGVEVIPLAVIAITSVGIIRNNLFILDTLHRDLDYVSTVRLLASCECPDDVRAACSHPRVRLDVRDEKTGNTLLHVSCGEHQQVDTFREIIRAVPDFVNVPNKQGQTPLLSICHALSFDTIDRARAEAMFDILLECESCDLDRRDASGRTPLLELCAIQKYWFDIVIVARVTRLIEKLLRPTRISRRGADVMARDANGITPLLAVVEWAAKTRAYTSLLSHPSVVTMGLQRVRMVLDAIKALRLPHAPPLHDRTFQDVRGRTPIGIACGAGAYDADLLLLLCENLAFSSSSSSSSSPHPPSHVVTECRNVT